MDRRMSLKPIPKAAQILSGSQESVIFDVFVRKENHIWFITLIYNEVYRFLIKTEYGF